MFLVGAGEKICTAPFLDAQELQISVNLRKNIFVPET